MTINLPLRSLLISSVLLGCRAEQTPLEYELPIIQLQAQSADKNIILQNEGLPMVEIYRAQSLRSPFSLPAAVNDAGSLVTKDCWQPQQRNGQGTLERYPLNHLNVKGVMSRANRHTALLQVPSGQVVSVEEGHFVGLNQGRVTQVTPEYVQIEETLPDGLGCWKRRDIKITLSAAAAEIGSIE
ncbi:fimbrial assembly protein [Vibrio ichthyoenteri ATCC 700023]|uniref:Fimbrial assembly protein n=1 Tax=Vibrio ichthyoenteri ATCC 700023 TaxID=870968 RepID=F9S8J6_9VIBR|nr:pilus assembly protein PilP [Vibrio ichthyoenteri]EGU29672.1 fimbrial assembly protein [Vibrio ichthyoenteri ATCC 700023]